MFHSGPARGLVPPSVFVKKQTNNINNKNEKIMVLDFVMYVAEIVVGCIVIKMAADKIGGKK